MVAGSGIFCNEIIAANEVHTRNGLFVVDSSLKVVNRYVSNKYNSKSLSNSSICSFAKDWSGNLWIGTYSGGINLIHPSDYNFGYIDDLMNNGGLSNKTMLQSLSSKGYMVPAGSAVDFCYYTVQAVYLLNQKWMYR